MGGAEEACVPNSKNGQAQARGVSQLVGRDGQQAGGGGQQLPHIAVVRLEGGVPFQLTAKEGRHMTL